MWRGGNYMKRYCKECKKETEQEYDGEYEQQYECDGYEGERLVDYYVCNECKLLTE